MVNIGHPALGALMLGYMARRLGLCVALVYGPSCAVDSTRCTSDQQCGPTMVCHEAKCVVPCVDDAVCGALAICQNGQCEPGCRINSDCPLGKICDESVCINGCVGRDRCEAFEYCSDQGQCLNGCARDGDCGAGQFCEDNKCVPIGSGFDGGPPQCQSHVDCRIGEFCAPDGRCRVGCRPGTCPRGQTCDEETGICSGAGQPPADAGPSADAGIIEDTGPSVAFDVRCSLRFNGESTSSLQVRADGQAAIELMPEFDAEIEWQVVASPSDAAAVIWGDAEGRNQPVALLRVGDHTLRATATYEGISESCELEIAGRPPPRGYWIELGWDGDRDLDLHLVPLPNQERCNDDRQCAQNQLRRTECNQNHCSRGFTSRDGRDGDCWARNANPLWGDPNDARSNPHYLGDVQSGAGTENIWFGGFENGWSSRLALRAWGADANQGWLRIFLDGRPVEASAALRIAPAEPNPWLYLGRLSADGYESVLEMSADPPRN